MSIKIDISYGELLDKITILEIKAERIADAAKLANISRELEVLTTTWNNGGIDTEAVNSQRHKLKQINESLWNIEDEIRDHEAAKSFGDSFIALARSVYKTNDQRAAVKKEINDLLGSALTEEKSYQAY